MVPGTVLGSYEILSLLGAGGMGEVYRARDTTLGRDVALKLLPAALADDPERVARFQREAQLLASLNHAHIGAIYGLEQAPSGRFLVLELLEGGTLAQRVERGPVPLEEAAAIARQIALALQAAHDKGVVHRDLKPSNVAFTAVGDVKVLDFGLAKLGDRAEMPITSASLSPTITSPALMTGVGALLGTAAYMAPEQAKGKPADKRSDVWAFGCVLYEMLTGGRAFEGDDIADTLANVLKMEPDWSRLPSALPPAISVLLRRCLAKDARQRCGDMAAALILLEESAHLSPGGAPSATAQRTPGVVQRLAVPATVAVVVAAAASAATWWAMRPEAPRIVRTSVVLSSGAATPTELAITPDGAHIVYTRNNQSQLVVRALDELEPRPLIGGSNIRGLSASPDSRSVVYTDGDMLMKMALSGGAAVPLTRVDAPARGTAWLADGTIVFATANGTTGLQRVAASGGEATVLTRPDPKLGEADHIAPTPLPGGRAGAVHDYLEYRRAPTDCDDGSRDRRAGRSSSAGSQARYLDSGHLVYAADGILQAVPFDLDTRTMTGTPVPVLQNFAMLGGVIAALDVREWHARVRPLEWNIAPPRVGRSRGPRDRNQGARRHVPDAAALA
jgi:serine/threonine-protein kinase